MLKDPHDVAGFGAVIWITGLSGSGKSTLAMKVTTSLRQAGKRVINLDGDTLREALVSEKEGKEKFERAGRLDLALKYSNICRMLASQGFFVVIGTISLFKEVHRYNREIFPNYFEVYLKVSLDELRRRDPKGIYKRFYSGELINVAGLDLHIDEPEVPDLLIKGDKKDDSAHWTQIILDQLKKRKLL